MYHDFGIAQALMSGKAFGEQLTEADREMLTELEKAQTQKQVTL